MPSKINMAFLFVIFFLFPLVDDNEKYKFLNKSWGCFSFIALSVTNLTLDFFTTYLSLNISIVLFTHRVFPIPGDPEISAYDISYIDII